MQCRGWAAHKGSETMALATVIIRFGCRPNDDDAEVENLPPKKRFQPNNDDAEVEETTAGEALKGLAGGGRHAPP